MAPVQVTRVYLPSRVFYQLWTAGCAGSFVVMRTVSFTNNCRWWIPFCCPCHGPRPGEHGSSTHTQTTALQTQDSKIFLCGIQILESHVGRSKSLPPQLQWDILAPKLGDEAPGHLREYGRQPAFTGHMSLILIRVNRRQGLDALGDVAYCVAIRDTLKNLLSCFLLTEFQMYSQVLPFASFSQHQLCIQLSSASENATFYRQCQELELHSTGRICILLDLSELTSLDTPISPFPSPTCTQEC